MVEFNTVAKANVHCMTVINFHKVNLGNVLNIQTGAS